LPCASAGRALPSWCFSLGSSGFSRRVAPPEPHNSTRLPRATMPQLTNAFVFHGGCHCGQLRAVFSTGLKPESIVPRCCDCSFCQKHGAVYVSDPAGHLSVIVHNPDALRRYRQGSNTAEFLVCDRCGVLVAVVFEHNARIYGAVNARSQEGPVGFGSAVPVSPQFLTAGEKTARWSQLWVPDVELLMSGP
jgi:hypothetical protein